jgi:hypothetical protein
MINPSTPKGFDATGKEKTVDGYEQFKLGLLTGGCLAYNAHRDDNCNLKGVFYG